MAKLPGINYNTPVSPLAQENVVAPLRTGQIEAGAITALANTVAEVADTIDANQVAQDAAKFQTSMAELNSTMKARKSYSIDELDALEIPYGTEYGAEGLSDVPAYKVSKQVYKKLTRELYDMSTATTSRKGRRVIAKMYGQMYKQGISPVIAQSYKDAIALKSLDSELAFDGAVSAGNSDAANIISRTALQTGIWTADKYMSKVRDMPDKVAQGEYLNELNIISDPVILKDKLDSSLIDPRLEPRSKASLYKSYSSKIKALEKEQDKARNEISKSQSYASYVDSSTGILYSGQPMDWNSIGNLALGMEPTDGKALISLNKSMMNKGVITDQTVFTPLLARIKSISIPRDGSTLSQRRKAVTEDILRASGIDPVTMQPSGNSKVAPEDMQTLWSEVNKSQNFVYQNPEVKRLSDEIWQTLTGGTKDMLSSIMGTGADAINATNAEVAMLNAARDSGPGFNAATWWESNKTLYLTKAYENNETRMQKNRAKKFVVKSPNMPGGIDIDKSIQGIHAQVKSGKMTREQAKEASQFVNDYYDRRAKFDPRTQKADK